MSTPDAEITHAPLATRKAVFTRTAILEAFSGIDERGLSPAEQADAEQVRDQLLSECASQAFRTQPDGLPLDGERLDAMAARIRSHAEFREPSARADGHPALAAMLREVTSRITQVDCGRCAQLGDCGPPCGENPNNELVSRRGECIAEVKETYAFGLALGRRLYSDALPRHNAALESNVTLRTHRLAREATVRGTVRLSARTDFRFDAGDHASIVTLAMDGWSYGETERDAALYLIVHEVVAHAFYDILSPDERVHRDPHDQWAEGWMDCVAADLLIATLQGDPRGVGSLPLRFRGDQRCIDVTRTIHLERYDPPGLTQTQPLNGMRLARRRYMAMRHRLRALDPSSNFDAMRTIQLACAIVNANGAADETVATINSAAHAFVFGAAESVELTPNETRFYHAMSAFLGHLDEGRLIRDLV